MGRKIKAQRWVLQNLKPQKPRADFYSRNPGLTETRLRPLARRREITALPCLVFMRVRKPCTFERLRRFGWNVRFGMEKFYSPYSNKTPSKRKSDGAPWNLVKRKYK